MTQETLEKASTDRLINEIAGITHYLKTHDNKRYIRTALKQSRGEIKQELNRRTE